LDAGVKANLGSLSYNVSPVERETIFTEALEGGKRESARSPSISC
jgi:hypothetical protein